MFLKLISISLVYLKFIHSMKHTNPVFFFIAEHSFIVWIYPCFPIYSLIHDCLYCFQFGPVINNTAINILISVCAQIHVQFSLYAPKIEFLVHTVTLHVTYWTSVKISLKVDIPFCMFTSNIQMFCFLCANICYYLVVVFFLFQPS